MAFIANCIRDKKKHPRAYQPSDFTPYKPDKQNDSDLEPIESLCDIYVDRPINAGNRSRKEKWKRRKEQQCNENKSSEPKSLS